jgi:hypothetical protein
MTPPSRLPRRIALAVTLLAGAFTAAAWMHPEQWWVRTSFFGPAVLGFMLVGGVHGDAPDWFVLLSTSVVNGTAWGGVTYWASRGLLHLAGRFSQTGEGSRRDLT